MDRTSIGVGSATRDRLKAYKEAIGADNYDEAINDVLDRVEVEIDP